MFLGLCMYYDWDFFWDSSHALSSDWNPLVESSEALERGSILGSQQQGVNMTYNPLKQHIHTDLITHYTGISLHLQTTTLHVRSSHEEFHALLWGSDLLSNGCGPLLPMHWNSSCHKNVWIKLVRANEISISLVYSSLTANTVRPCTSIISSVNRIQTANLDLSQGQKEL